jgi:hypothetical protein
MFFSRPCLQSWQYLEESGRRREGAVCSHPFLVSACKANMEQQGHGPKEQWEAFESALRLFHSFFAEALQKEDKVEKGREEAENIFWKLCFYPCPVLLADMKGKGKVKSENGKRRFFLFYLAGLQNCKD